MCGLPKHTSKAIQKPRNAADKKLNKIGLHVGKIEKTTRFFHFIKMPVKNNAVAEGLTKAAMETSGRKLEVGGAFLSDLSLIVKHGSSNAIGFGIGRDFDVYGGAHQNDEYIECDVLLEFAKIIGAFLTQY